MAELRDFIDKHFRHFNAAVVVDAARAWTDHIDGGGKMMLTIAGAMSTGELGMVIAELIRQEKVHALTVTGANLEEDLFNLVAHDHYVRLPNYRQLTPEQERDLMERGLNRVTDTCIPEEEAMRRIERLVMDEWRAAESAGERYFPHEYLYRLIRGGKLESMHQIDPAASWLVAASERDLPIWVPGWEDSTLGNMFVAAVKLGKVASYQTVKSGPEYMGHLVDWYDEVQKDASMGFFQIGGGIAGDFPICVVPLMHQDMKRQVRFWGYFCQISDSTTSYGSYSGAVPNEKITWGKLEVDTPRFIIESDATIVFPLVAAHVLGW